MNNAKFNFVFYDIKDRLDKDKIAEFHTYWGLQLAVTLDELIVKIASKITEIILDDDMDSDAWICFGENGKYEIDLSYDRTSAECWMYPMAYGRRMEEDVAMILKAPEEPADFFIDCLKKDMIDAFAEKWRIRDVLDLELVRKWIEEDVKKFITWPEDTWYEHTFATLVSEDAQHIDLQYTEDENGTECIMMYPVLYNNTLTEFGVEIYRVKETDNG